MSLSTTITALERLTRPEPEYHHPSTIVTIEAPLLSKPENTPSHHPHHRLSQALDDTVHQTFHSRLSRLVDHQALIENAGHRTDDQRLSEDDDLHPSLRSRSTNISGPSRSSLSALLGHPTKSTSVPNQSQSLHQPNLQNDGQEQNLVGPVRSLSSSLRQNESFSSTAHSTGTHRARSGCRSPVRKDESSISDPKKLAVVAPDPHPTDNRSSYKSSPSPSATLDPCRMTGSNNPEVEPEKDPSRFDRNSEEWKRNRKNTHKEVERRRRETINEGITELKKIVPGAEKNKGEILKQAVKYIQDLQETLMKHVQQNKQSKLLADKTISGHLEKIKELKTQNQEEIDRLKAHNHKLQDENRRLKSLSISQLSEILELASKLEEEEGGSGGPRRVAKQPVDLTSDRTRFQSQIEKINEALNLDHLFLPPNSDEFNEKESAEDRPKGLGVKYFDPVIDQQISRLNLFPPSKSSLVPTSQSGPRRTSSSPSQPQTQNQVQEIERVDPLGSHPDDFESRPADHCSLESIINQTGDHDHHQHEGNLKRTLEEIFDNDRDREEEGEGNRQCFLKAGDRYSFHHHNNNKQMRFDVDLHPNFPHSQPDATDGEPTDLHHQDGLDHHCPIIADLSDEHALFYSDHLLRSHHYLHHHSRLCTPQRNLLD